MDVGAMEIESVNYPEIGGYLVNNNVLATFN